MGQAGRRGEASAYNEAHIDPRLVIDVRATQRVLADQFPDPANETSPLPIMGRSGGTEDDDPPAGTWTGIGVRAGIKPLLILLDLIACLAGTLASGGIRAVMALFTILLISTYATGGLYRSRLSPSLLDDLPQLAGRLLVVLALTMTGQLTLNQLRWDAELVDWKLLIAAAVTGFVSICLRSIVSDCCVRSVSTSEGMALTSI
jgi:hypothetical protein